MSIHICQFCKTVMHTLEKGAGYCPGCQEFDASKKLSIAVRKRLTAKAKVVDANHLG